MMVINAFIEKLRITHALSFVYMFMICLYLVLAYKLLLRPKISLRSKYDMK